MNLFELQQFWNNSKRYNDFSGYFKRLFSNRVQKISIDAGFTCPNRDGSKSLGGCLYCNNKTFNPFYCAPEKSVTQQLNEGIAFFSAKYQTQKYLAYFQAYTNTYADLETLKKLFSQALEHPQVIGLVISTRPDSIDNQKLDYLQQLAETYYVVLEIGVESTLNKTLQLINRGHSFEETILALESAANRGIHVGTHMILGLPGESRNEILQHAQILSELPFETLKLHQLQIIKGTAMADWYERSPQDFQLYDVDSYIDLVVDFVELLRPQIIVERFISESPIDMLIAPRWNGLKNFEIVSRIEKKLENRDTWQSKKKCTID